MIQDEGDDEQHQQQLLQQGGRVWTEGQMHLPARGQRQGQRAAEGDEARAPHPPPRRRDAHGLAAAQDPRPARAWRGRPRVASAASCGRPSIQPYLRRRGARAVCQAQPQFCRTVRRPRKLDRGADLPGDRQGNQPDILDHPRACAGLDTQPVGCRAARVDVERIGATAGVADVAAAARGDDPCQGAVVGGQRGPCQPIVEPVALTRNQRGRRAPEGDDVVVELPSRRDLDQPDRTGPNRRAVPPRRWDYAGTAPRCR